MGTIGQLPHYIQWLKDRGFEIWVDVDRGEEGRLLLVSKHGMTGVIAPNPYMLEHDVILKDIAGELTETTKLPDHLGTPAQHFTFYSTEGRLMGYICTQEFGDLVFKGKPKEHQAFMLAVEKAFEDRL